MKSEDHPGYGGDRGRTRPLASIDRAMPEQGDRNSDLVLVSDLREADLPDTKKYPLWLRLFVLVGGAIGSWAILYAVLFKLILHR